MVDYNPLIPCLDHGTCDKRNHGFDLQWFMADIAFHSLVHSKCLITVLSKSHKWGYLIYGGFLNWGYPYIIHFWIGVFHCKTSILEIHH